MRSIVRRDTGESYEEFLCGLAKASGIATPTREDLVRLDRKRKKRSSNKERKSPADGDARIANMKDGRTHLAHKAEHAVDLDTGAIVAATPANGSAPRTVQEDRIELWLSNNGASVVHSCCTVVPEQARGTPKMAVPLRRKLLNPNNRPQDGLVC